jgi:hypothetical protein
MIFTLPDGKEVKISYRPTHPPINASRYAKGVLTSALGTAKPRSSKSKSPTKKTAEDWLFAEPSDAPELEESNVGKWMMFVSWDKIDDTWTNVSSALTENKLYPAIAAKVTTQRSANPSYHVICIYLADSNDRAAAMTVREKLRNIGFEHRLYFKTNVMTANGVSGSLFSA